MEMILPYLAALITAVVGGFTGVWAMKLRSKEINTKQDEHMLKSDHELREQIRMLWEENRKLREEIDELRRELHK